METGLLNFHDEETFATSLYDQGDFSGVDGQGSLLDMMHSDLQYSSDYLNQSAVHWDSDQEQEHNGDLAVLPVAASECSSLNSSKEDYHKSLFEWQDSLIPYQPLDPDGVDLRLDGQVIPSELPDNIFEDSFESNSSASSSLPKPSLPNPVAVPPRSSTPNPSLKESVSSDGSLNLDMSLSGLDVNVSDIDMSALGINVSSLDIKSDPGDIVEVKPVTSLEDTGLSDSNSACVRKSTKTEKLKKSSELQKMQSELSVVEDHEFTALFGVPEGPSPFGSTTETNDSVQLSTPKIENPDVDIAMEFIKEEQEAQAWSSLPLLDTALDCNVDLDSIADGVPVLEAGNLESLLEQFEATLKPAPEFTQSMPASPAHFSIPPSPLSMPASPSCITMPSSPLPTYTPFPSASKNSPVPSPAKSKSESTTPKKTSSKGVSVLHQNILESLPTEIMDRIKASGRKKAIAVIPAMPTKKTNRSSIRMHAAGATLSRNKMLKLVSRKGGSGENIQFDHDYCSSDSSSNVEFVPEKLVEDIKASTKLLESEEEKHSRKDSGLESGDASEDSEGVVIPPIATSILDSASSGCRSNLNSILKPRSSNPTGRNKEMLMVSVLKKVRCDNSNSPTKPLPVMSTSNTRIVNNSQCPNGLLNVKCSTKPMSVCNSKPSSLGPIKMETTNMKHLVSNTSSNALPNSKLGGISSKAAQTVVVKRVDPVRESRSLLAKPMEKAEKSSGSVCKVEPVETVQANLNLFETSGTKVEIEICNKPVEQPKKRKLNLEEYYSRQKTLEQKRDVKKSADASAVDLPFSPKPNNCETKAIPVMEDSKNQAADKMETASEVIVDKVVAVNLPIVIKVEANIEPVSQHSTSNSAPEVVKGEETLEAMSGTEVSSCSPVVIKVEKCTDLPCEEEVTCVSPAVLKEEAQLSEAILNDDEDQGDFSKPTEDRPKVRQYRTRRMSTSSSEGSPQLKGVKDVIMSIKRENIQRKVNLFPTKSKSRSVSPSTLRRSRSASSSSSRSSRSSSSDSHSSRCESVSSSRKRRTAQRRRRKNSSSRSRDRSSSRSSLNSSCRSNSMSSGSSHRSSRRSSSSRRRSRSRSTRRSRRDRSMSRSSWRQWRRDMSRSRNRRERRHGDSRSSCGRCCSGSRSRRSLSRSSCRRRYRSPSRSRIGRRFCSYSSRSESRSRSRSVSRSRSHSSGCEGRRSWSRSRSRGRKRASRLERQRSAKRKSMRSRSPIRRNIDWTRVEKEHNRQVEERRVIYVGRIPGDTTKAQLKKRFEMFGPILDISLHFREHADGSFRDNYGFVTFAYKVDAYDAVERGNDDPNLPRYELCFGGRRKFCRERYADLDGMACKNGMGGNLPPHISRPSEPNSFDDMLREVQAKLQARKKL